MLKYSLLSADQKRAIQPREIFRVVGGIAYPFQTDFRDVLRAAIDKNKYLQVEHIKDHDAQRRAYGNLPNIAYGIEDENIAAYILLRAKSIQHHDNGDIGVLQLKQPPFSSVVLWGESLKGWLHYGIADFVVPGNDVKAELQQIIDAWKKFSEQNLQGSSVHYDIAHRLTHHDPEEFMQRYWDRNHAAEEKSSFEPLPSTP